MYEYIKLFYEIVIFRKGPQDIPASQWLLRLLIPVYMAINFLILKLSADASSALQQVLVEVVLIIVFSWGLLSLFGKPERFRQTACALLGTDALLSLFALPAIASLVGQGSAPAFVVVVILMLWHWVVTGHILKYALSQPLIFALGVSFLYILASYQVMALLFPELANP
ncbi:hypothetical protein Q9L42_002235 [Methylomarinum sp. Ch1-1]|uniref:Yip1 domain-containing protein n=1 Tax=Methylomarinum roseum TaxID=3067653 RepID=A0AAU7NVE6_9GAMM|nr:hypothetical protein [Methylomarinum sp. Ch1-1]MDP4523006.1 hypothetical protein [Methylomarinum sp. Ch1-1]